MNLLLVWLGLFSFFSLGYTERKSKFKSGVPHVISPYEKPNPPFKLHLSAWELNLVNEILMDIMMSKCETIYADEANDLKTYISEQLEKAPTQSSLNPKFLNIYSNLISCLQISQDKSPRRISFEENEIKPSKIVSENEIPVTKQIQFKQENQVVGQNTFEKAEILSTKEIIKFQQQLPKNDEDNSKILVENSPNENNKDIKSSEPAKVTTKTQSVTTLEPKDQSGGFLGAVGHLFSKLYENTINFFSLFGRKKREAHHSDGKPRHWKTIQGKEIIAKHSSKHYNNAAHNHNLKNIPRKLNKVISSARSSKMHFNEILNSLTYIATSSCPTQLMPMVGFVNEAIHEILWYINKDLEDVAANGETLTIDVELSNRIKSCVKSWQMS